MDMNAEQTSFTGDGSQVKAGLVESGPKAMDLFKAISRLVGSLQALQQAVTIAPAGGPVWVEIAFLAVEHGPTLF